MRLGLFLIREFRISSRRRGLFFGRAASAVVVLVVIGCCTLAWDYFGWDRSSIRGMARFTLQTFGAIVAIQAMGTWGAIPTVVAPRIAGERERKTLDALLASRLSSAEIVLGMTAEGLVPYFSDLAVVFPIVLLMVPLGGIDPRLVLLAFGGLGSMTVFLAGLSSAVSAGARDIRVALAWSRGLGMVWACVPFLVVTFLPGVWPAAARGIAPVALVALDSSPVGVLANLGGVVRRCGEVESILRMIGLQVIGGVLLLVVATVRLRSASRSAHDGENRTAWLLQTSRWRRKPWPDCGDDPVFWRERNSRPTVTRIGRILGGLVGIVLVGCLVAGTSWFGNPAFRELFVHGYGATGVLEIRELSLLELAVPRAWYGDTSAGRSRVEFNAVLRQFTVVWDLFYVVSLAGLAAVGIGRERAQDTWSGLLATPLTAREIIRAKMLGAVWQTRMGALVLIAVWTVGLLAGSVHPLGYALAIAGLGISTWFLVSLGTFFSLRATDVSQATSRVTAVVGVLVFSALLPVVLPWCRWPASILMGAGSAPMHAGLALVSYEDVREAFRSGAFPALGVLGLGTGERAWVVLATCLIGLAGQAVAACMLTRSVIANLDRLVGRPHRLEQRWARPGCLPAAVPTGSVSEVVLGQASEAHDCSLRSLAQVAVAVDGHRGL